MKDKPREQTSIGMKICENIVFFLILIFTDKDMGYTIRLWFFKKSSSELIVQQKELYKSHTRNMDTIMVLFVMHPVCFLHLFQLFVEISKTG